MNSSLLSEWMARARVGDAEAKEIVLYALSEQLPAVLTATAGRSGYRLKQQEVEELTQDMLASVVSAKFSYDSEKGAFGTWATTVAQRRLVRHFRDQARLRNETDLTSYRYKNPYSVFTPLAAAPEGPHAPETEHAATERFREQFEAGIKYLSAKEAEVLRLTYEGFNTYEIAAKIGVTHNTVSNYLAAGYEHLRAREPWLSSPQGRARAAQIDRLAEPDRSIFIAVKLDGVSDVSAGRFFGVRKNDIRDSLRRSERLLQSFPTDVCRRTNDEAAD